MKTLKTIKIEQKVHRQLTNIGLKNESYSQIIERLIHEKIK